MVAHDDDRDVARMLEAGYGAPPPPPAFVEQTRMRLQQELQAAQASRRRLLRVWRHVAAAAVIVVAAGLAVVGFRGTSCAPRGAGTLPGPEAFSTPRRPVPLRLQLPSPFFLCTNRLIRLTAHMEPYEPDKPRPPLFVPAGTRNLALRKPVTCSEEMGVVVGDLFQVNDGEKSGLHSGYVELISPGGGPTWVQIDLEEPRAIYAIVLWRSVWPTVFHDVIVQVSDDAEFRRGVHTLFNNDYDHSTGLDVGTDREYVSDYRGRVIDAAGVVARYVRLYSRGCIDGSLDRYVEVEVHGRPVAEAALDAPGSVPLDVKAPRPGTVDGVTTVPVGFASLVLGEASRTVLNTGALPGPVPRSTPRGALVPLNIRLPGPEIDGTPKHIKPHAYLEKYTGKPRPPFMVPEGTTNLARGGHVTASDSEPIIGELTYVTDGDKQSNDGYYVELAPGRQWVQIDLERTCAIYAVLVWRYHAEFRVYHDLVVQVADDPDFIENVRTIYNNDFDNSAGLGIGKDLEYIEDFRGRLIDAGGAKARYVRLYSNGNTSNDQNHYIEVEVHGKPEPKQVPLKTDLPQPIMS
jgi:hypothetical protein